MRRLRRHLALAAEGRGRKKAHNGLGCRQPTVTVTWSAPPAAARARGTPLPSNGNRPPVGRGGAGRGVQAAVEDEARQVEEEAAAAAARQAEEEEAAAAATTSYPPSADPKAVLRAARKALRTD